MTKFRSQYCEAFERTLYVISDELTINQLSDKEVYAYIQKYYIFGAVNAVLDTDGIFVWCLKFQRKPNHTRNTSEDGVCVPFPNEEMNPWVFLA